MLPAVYLVNVRWDGVAGATGYEIRKNGVKVATAGPNARTSRVSVGDQTVIEIIDLPARSKVQAVEFTQAASA